MEVIIGQKKKSTTKSPLADKFITTLLRPSTYSNLPADAEFAFSSEDIIDLCTQCEKVIAN